MKHIVDVMISEEEIKQRIAELGREITEHYRSRQEKTRFGLNWLIKRLFLFLWRIYVVKLKCHMKSIL